MNAARPSLGGEAGRSKDMLAMWAPMQQSLAKVKGIASQ